MSRSSLEGREGLSASSLANIEVDAWPDRQRCFISNISNGYQQYGTSNMIALAMTGNAATFQPAHRQRSDSVDSQV
jgi:hypothetical protein